MTMLSVIGLQPRLLSTFVVYSLHGRLSFSRGVVRTLWFSYIVDINSFFLIYYNNNNNVSNDYAIEWSGLKT
jgi:hypothetical protein